MEKKKNRKTWEVPCYPTLGRKATLVAIQQPNIIFNMSKICFPSIHLTRTELVLTGGPC